MWSGGLSAIDCGYRAINQGRKIGRNCALGGDSTTLPVATEIGDQRLDFSATAE